MKLHHKSIRCRNLFQSTSYIFDWPIWCGNFWLRVVGVVGVWIGQGSGSWTRPHVSTLFPSSRRNSCHSRSSLCEESPARHECTEVRSYVVTRSAHMCAVLVSRGHATAGFQQAQVGQLPRSHYEITAVRNVTTPSSDAEEDAAAAAESVAASSWYVSNFSPPFSYLTALPTPSVLVWAAVTFPLGFFFSHTFFKHKTHMRLPLLWLFVTVPLGFAFWRCNKYEALLHQPVWCPPGTDRLLVTCATNWNPHLKKTPSNIFHHGVHMVKAVTQKLSKSLC